MANPVFPASLAPLQDSKYYEVEQEDTSMRSKTEGGYVVSRARHTRTPRKTFSTGFTSISAAQFATLQGFFDSLTGGVVFDWTDPATGALYSVRFAEGPLKSKYVGMGNNRRYDVSFQLVQV